MTSVARVRENALLSGDLARMTRERWCTKCRRRPRRGAESLLSSHAVDSVGVERRVSPPPCRGAMLTFRPSLPDQMTQETRKYPNGAAVAILAVQTPRSPRHDYYERISCLGAAAVDTSYAIVRASFSPNHHSEQRFLELRRPKSLA
jgi:hypothetical protein